MIAARRIAQKGKNKQSKYDEYVVDAWKRWFRLHWELFWRLVIGRRSAAFSGVRQQQISSSSALCVVRRNA
jgi:hypothetical protein